MLPYTFTACFELELVIIVGERERLLLPEERALSGRLVRFLRYELVGMRYRGTCCCCWPRLPEEEAASLRWPGGNSVDCWELYDSDKKKQTKMSKIRCVQTKEQR